MDAIRAVYVLLRVARDNETGEADYPAHRDLLSLLSGVGVKTVLKLAEACIQKQQNFHDLVYQQPPPNWLQGKLWRRSKDCRPLQCRCCLENR